MIKGDFTHCTTLQQFYDEIVAVQKEAHGDEYTSHHGDLTDLMLQCKTYKELGVNQGATAAAVLLQAPKSIELIDIVLTNFNENRHLFEQFAQENDVLLSVKEIGSTDPELDITECDLLFVDSLHHIWHIEEELRLHAPKTNKYIVIHDTEDRPMNHAAALNVLMPLGWKEVRRDRRGYGHSIFKRV
jgi:hypothetical protein